MNKKYLRWIFIIGLLMLALIVVIGVALTTGELQISIFDVWNILQKGQGSIEYTIIHDIRLPRILLGLAVGGALSISGVILQAIYRNPLVEPYTLGISGGASLGIAIVFVFGLHLSLGALILPFAGFTGALLSMILVYYLAIKQGKIKIQHMLLIGLMISFIASSALMLLMSISSTENLHGIIFWIMGSLDEPNRTLINLNLGVSVFGLVATYLFVQPLNALRLGEEKARHLGINTETAIRTLFLIASLLAGVSVAVAGVIGFVGLIIPHLMRLWVGSDYRILILSSYISGSIFIILSDAIARTIILPNELPIGVITGIIGGSIFVVVLSRSSKKII
ncbi:MAG: iron ABC transporter permease [Bacteroidetes bacterium]|nr:iron ABC transporter permease [Bacteroidota bacterium]